MMVLGEGAKQGPYAYKKLPQAPTPNPFCKNCRGTALPCPKPLAMVLCLKEAFGHP